jgi:hypothetical protein
MDPRQIRRGILGHVLPVQSCRYSERPAAENIADKSKYTLRGVAFRRESVQN